MNADTVTLTGRVLYLTRDPAWIRRQLGGEVLRMSSELELCENVSTDEITPAWTCYYYDRTLGRYCLVGLRGGTIERDALLGGGFQVLVSGAGKGCGSSRETAPYAELVAGIQVVFSPKFEKIYLQNCQNIGLLASSDFALLERLERGEAVPRREFSRGASAISRSVIEAGGLFAFNRERLAGTRSLAPPERTPRPMTLAEKILAAHAVRDAERGAVGVPAVAPGDAFFARVDLRFTHDYVTAMADALFRQGFGEEVRVSEPASVYAFRDHLTFLDRVMPEEHRALGLLSQAGELAEVQERFSERHGVRLFGEVKRDGVPAGSEAICHNKVIEELALPGQVVIGSDSHTCMAGVLGCLAFGVGSTDMANAWLTRDVRVEVPETLQIVLDGALAPGVCAKDVMLYLLAMPLFREGRAVGKVLEFSGSGLGSMPLGERATLTNMAVEAGGFTGIIAADASVVEYLAQARGLSASRLESRLVQADPDATYAERVQVDLTRVPPMIALPSDPKSGIPLEQLSARSGGEVRIDIAYGGSCTGGKQSDMDLYARVLGEALAEGQRVAPGVEFFLQFGSQTVRRYAESRGYLELFARAGATLLDPSCGACIRAGPGISRGPEQVTVSAANRNFPGRSGPGRVYLASPLVVAASAIAGKIVAPSAGARPDRDRPALAE